MEGIGQTMSSGCFSKEEATQADNAILPGTLQNTVANSFIAFGQKLQMPSSIAAYLQYIDKLIRALQSHNHLTIQLIHQKFQTIAFGGSLLTHKTAAMQGISTMTVEMPPSILQA